MSGTGTVVATGAASADTIAAGPVAAGEIAAGEIAAGEIAEVRFPAIGTTAVVLVTRPAAAARAGELLAAELAALDRACSRFRPDSEIRDLERTAGTAVRVSPLLAQVLETALWAAEASEGLVDPTVGAALDAIGYDRDFGAVPADGPAITPVPARGWWRIGWDAQRREVLLPRGIRLDVGSSAKALAADRSAAQLAAELDCGVLVSLGGDIATAGQAPEGGWQVLVGDDHTRPAGAAGGQVVVIASGGLATSGTARRRWRRGGGHVHHIVDPRTGRPAAGGWRTVSVAAASCVEANVATTAALVLGAAAPGWLAHRGLPARLVADGGEVTTVGGWPAADPDPMETY